MPFTLNSDTFKWQNYGPFAWQQVENHVILLPGPTLVIEHLQYYLSVSVTSNCGSAS